ncbi:MAG: hypothetical protein VR73_08950 [Gammaproteobacteria bacterium BRH_c0]|nr:MAG: hypothetical protein VR73_08950 [Gammaproteobacteria bacterium BRH_c0]
MIYEPVSEDAAPCFEEIKAFITKGISAWSKKGLAYRVLRIPFDLHHPVWVKDRDFSLDEYIHHIALPAPGDKHKLCDFISYIMSMPLDPNRPLWDSWLVEGLEGNRIAWFCKMHHVLADGLMSAEQISNIHRQRPPQGSDDDVELISDIDRIPNKFQLMGSALIDLFKSYTHEFPDYYRSYLDSRKNKKALKESKRNAYTAFQAPHTFLNEAGGPYRSYRYETFSLQDFRTISRNLHCTINDLVLTLSSEALRRYFLEFNRPIPTTPLVVVMPVANRGDGNRPTFLNTETQNNNVSIAYVPLDLQIKDFMTRLESVKQGAGAAMERIRQTNGARMDNFFDFMPGSFIRLLNWVLARRQRQGKSPMANMAISNVPGPREPLYACNGRLKMVELLSCGNLIDIGALGITVWSYLDNLCFSCLFRKGTLPQPERFTHHLNEAYQELYRDHFAQTSVEQHQMAASNSNPSN